MDIFREIRNSVSGVIGLYIMDSKGNLLASDVPELFRNELKSVSDDLMQLAEIIRLKRNLDRIVIEADHGYITLNYRNDLFLGAFASKNTDVELLELVANKAVSTLRQENIPGPSPKAQPLPVVASPAQPPASAQGGREVPEDVRVSVCKAIKGKVTLLYGPKIAEQYVAEAFEAAGVERTTKDPAKLKIAFDKLGNGVLAKMLGDKKAKSFLEELYKEYGLK